MNGNHGGNIPLQTYISILMQRPDGIANIQGSKEYAGIRGQVRFYQAPNGVLVFADITGLPVPSGKCQSPFFAFHIHSGGQCTGNESDPFANAQGHYNPQNCLHPHHAGDLPPLLGNRGRALQVFLTDRFSVREVIGKTVIIHSGPDDFTSQPAGNAGAKIACGEIRGTRSR